MKFDLEFTVTEPTDDSYERFIDNNVVLRVVDEDESKYDFVWKGSYKKQDISVYLPKYGLENDLIINLPSSLSGKEQSIREQVKEILKTWD